MLYLVLNGSPFTDETIDTGEILCLVEGESSPYKLLLTLEERKIAEDRRYETYKSQFKAKEPYPKYPTKSFWVSARQFADSYAMKEFEKLQREYWHKQRDYYKKYQPKDIIPTVPDFLVSHGYGLVTFEKVSYENQDEAD